MRKVLTSRQLVLVLACATLLAISVAIPHVIAGYVGVSDNFYMTVHTPTVFLNTSEQVTVQTTGYYYIEAWGGNGGQGGTAASGETNHKGYDSWTSGGTSNRIAGLYKFNAGDVLDIHVGALGKNASGLTAGAGGSSGLSFGNGGTGGAGIVASSSLGYRSGAGGGGGAASFVMNNGSAISQSLIVSGGAGGGGGEGSTAGAGDGAIGGNGASSSGNGSVGATASDSSTLGYHGGSGGTNNTNNGGTYNGGTGEASTNGSSYGGGAGGGGGGGYTNVGGGGGKGASGTSGWCRGGGGGGGGASYISSANGYVANPSSLGLSVPTNTRPTNTVQGTGSGAVILTYIGQ